MGKAQNPDSHVTKRIEIPEALLFGEIDRRQKRVKLIREISERERISERTLRRWLFAYEHEGYQGLIPKSKHGGKQSSSAGIADQAVMLRRRYHEASARLSPS